MTTTPRLDAIREAHAARRFAWWAMVAALVAVGVVLLRARGCA